MEKVLLDEFLRFASEKYGIKVKAIHTDNDSDTFEKLFGVSFLENDVSNQLT